MLQAKDGAGGDRRIYVRFYLVPGFGHAKGIFNAGFDALGVLDRMGRNRRGRRTGLVATDNNRSQHGRTRPLCVFPAWPKYVGGDAGQGFELRLRTP